MDTSVANKSMLLVSQNRFSSQKPEVKWVSVNRLQSFEEKRKAASTTHHKRLASNTVTLSDNSNLSSFDTNKSVNVNEYGRRYQYRRICVILLTAAIVAAILASITAIILVFTLKSIITTTTLITSTSTSTTTSTSSTTTSATTTICTSSGHGNMGVLTGYAGSAWTQYSTSFSATKSSYILVFGFQAAVNRSWLLDNTSVIRNSHPNTQLLNNADFENSNTSISGWTLWCSSYCQFGTSGQLLDGPDCYLGTGICFTSSCLGFGIEFLGQYFSTNSGSTYTISFYVALTGVGNPYNTMLYVDVF